MRAEGAAAAVEPETRPRHSSEHEPSPQRAPEGADGNVAPRRRRRRGRRAPASAAGSPEGSGRAGSDGDGIERDSSARRPDRARSRRSSSQSRGPAPRSRSAEQKALASGGYTLPTTDVVDAIDLRDAPGAFRALDLSDRALAIVTALGFDEPTPIQEQAVPLLLAGRDVVGQAQTGTGKTLAFGLLIVERLDPQLPEVQAIVLVPTRELAQQVFGVLEFLAEAKGLQATALMGGRRLAQDFDALERRPQIVVGTPGRVIDHLQRGTLSLRRVRVAVLDEADRMLDIGFEPDMRRILSRCPDDRQTALFSATIPPRSRP